MVEVTQGPVPRALHTKWHAGVGWGQARFNEPSGMRWWLCGPLALSYHTSLALLVAPTSAKCFKLGPKIPWPPVMPETLRAQRRASCACTTGHLVHYITSDSNQAKYSSASTSILCLLAGTETGIATEEELAQVKRKTARWDEQEKRTAAQLSKIFHSSLLQPPSLTGAVSAGRWAKLLAQEVLTEPVTASQAWLKTSLALYAFLRGLRPAHLRQQVRITRPDSLNEVLSHAEDLDTILNDNRGRSSMQCMGQFRCWACGKKGLLRRECRGPQASGTKTPPVCGRNRPEGRISSVGRRGSGDRRGECSGRWLATTEAKEVGTE
ncbi:hypothetical protein SKAU_G00064410 [Synaphobranchus kaupii]|uniref:CCHC-type domain-containing protein n=1 Tax=Synaphobranchus kaupii TaxID=118154 RepID=A0A9Q1G6F3_SYNKA|nr:hypothetical protein SKAU_G00064410 [Synaphobranchus kaupii]